MAIPKSVHLEGAGSAATTFAGVNPVVLVPDGSGLLALPAASFVTDGRFVRDGNDLLIRDAAGDAVVIRNYFGEEPAPSLTSADGSQVLTPGLVDSFLTPAAPGQYAQAAPIAGAPPIGQVIDLDGNAFAIRADGTRVQLAKGDAVHEGDIVETGGAGSAIRMVFTDKTEFSLGADARLALDQLVFNPDTQAGAAQFSVLKGVFIFASGQIAKTDNTDMTVITPVATIGIRGTEVAGRVSASDSQFTVIDGAIEVTTQAGSVTLDGRGETTQVAGNDSAPGEPAVLTPEQFGKAYGEIAGVASTYFDQSQPGIHTPGGGAPADPIGPEPDNAPADPGDRADAGTAPGGAAPAGLLAPEILGIAPLAAMLAEGARAASPAVPLETAEVMQDDRPDDDPAVVAAVPGLDLANNLTFSLSTEPDVGPAGFELLPSVGNGAAVPGEMPASGIVQIAFSPVLGSTADLGTAQASSADVTAVGSPPLDQPSTGGSGSPFRSGSGSDDPFSGNPYLTTPFGYSGPQLGDPVFDLVAGPGSAPSGPSNSADDLRDADEAALAAPHATDERQAAEDPIPQRAPAEVTLIVSNATRNQQTQDMTLNFELRDEGPGSFIFSGDEIGLPGVAAGAEIFLQRGGDGSVAVTLSSAWDSVKNLRAESTTAADIRIDNFVHADVHFGDGGDSRIAIHGAKRGFVTTGNGNDSVEIDAYSNGAGWSHMFDVRAGAGDDILVFDGAANGLSRLYFDGGEGTDTLSLSGQGQSFSLLPGQIQVTGVERIDISGPGNATLTLPANLSSPSDMLIVDGDAEDVLDLHGDGWTSADPTGNDFQGYAVYEHASGMRVAADLDLQVT